MNIKEINNKKNDNYGTILMKEIARIIYEENQLYNKLIKKQVENQEEISQPKKLKRIRKNLWKRSKV